LADAGKKSSGPNEGTYFVAFGEDGTSSNANRTHQALAENTDFLDDVLHVEIPVVANQDGLAAGALGTLALTGHDVWVGTIPFPAGTAVDNLNRLISIVYSPASVTNGETPYDEVINGAGKKVEITDIQDGGGTSVLGTVGGFYVNPTLIISPAIPSGTQYRIIFGKKSSFTDISAASFDAMTRVAIRSADEGSAEVVRFMRETARRFTGQVAALVATTIESPSTYPNSDNILSPSNVMNLAVDPNDDTAFNGALNVTFNRDTGAAVSLFSVLEGASAGTSLWQNTDERIDLADVNTLASGFAETHLPFSSGTATEGDSNLRVFEKDPGAVPVSIVKRLNAQWSATIGDGAVTFGDFNGVTALTDAITAAQAGAADQIYIRVKRGTYTVNALNMGGLDELTIEGTDQEGCIIQNVGASAGITVNQDKKCFLRRLQFTTTGTPLAFLFNRSIVRIEDCTFVGQSIEHQSNDGSIAGYPVFYMTRSSITAATGTPCVTLAGGAGATFTNRGFIWEDCEFTGVADNPVLRASSAGTISGTFEGVHFNRCVMNLASTTTSAGVIGRNLDGNPGVFELSGTGVFRLDDITWEKCQVFANTTAGDNSILLNLKTIGNGNQLVVREVNILGGRWECPAGTTEIAPFYVGSIIYNESSVERVNIQDVTWGFVGNADYGAPEDSIQWLDATAPAPGVGPRTAEDWAAFYIVVKQGSTSTGTVTMKNVTWISATVKSRCGDLMIWKCGRFDIDGIWIADTWFESVNYTEPSCRVRFVGDDETTSTRGSRGSISNVVISAENKAQIAQPGVFHLVPNGQMLVHGCEVSGIGGGGAGRAAFYVDMNNTTWGDGAAGTASTWDGLHLDQCRVYDVNPDGFWADVGGFVAVVTGGVAPRDWDITGCVFSGGGQKGIFIDGDAAQLFGEIRISNCQFEHNAEEGIYMVAGFWDITEPGIIFTGNTFVNNNGSSANVQVYVNDSSSAVGAIYGNSCDSFITGTSVGLLHLDGGPSFPLRGTETGYTYDPTSLTAVESINCTITSNSAAADCRNHVNFGSQRNLLHNRMKLLF
jgi:hypothetical protein